jgi:hypothetical protein
MVSVLVLKVVDHGFIGGVMVSVLVFERVDCGFIGGVMVNVFILKTVYLLKTVLSSRFMSPSADKYTLFRNREPE